MKYIKDTPKDPWAVNEPVSVSAVRIAIPSNSEEDVYYHVMVNFSCHCKSFYYRSTCTHVSTLIQSIM